jgi:hypothetical protein
MAIAVPILLKPTPANPWQRLPVQPISNGYPQQLDTVTVPASSLSPQVKQVLSKQIAAGNTVTGYILRNAYSTTLPAATASYCLTATTKGSAVANGDPVEAITCQPGALSQVWIPAQYEASGTTHSWLVNAEYPSMCLNADNRGGGVHQRSKVQLWKCGWPRQGVDPARYNEYWDFRAWLTALKSGANSYPLFLGSGNFSVDADDHALGDGLGTATVSMINHYTVAWEYWY